MSAFIGSQDIGIWVSNGERDALLDWFADNRRSPGDTRWQWCKDGGQRWTGRRLDLAEFLQTDEQFHVTDEELRAAHQTYGPDISQLLRRLEQICRGEWLHNVSSGESLKWRGR